jgi:adenosylcobyric acid synthase
MVQGTASHVGKSLIVAGLCRVFRDQGIRVVPFKSQNMALNAYVTRDGGELGWAQAMQAEAARLEPRVEMNPILLKPESDRRSQVILLGKVLGTTDAADYYRMTARLREAVAQSYRSLAAEADLVLIEGAGNPAEPNLMDRDLANMAVARLARAPVLLVGDIDRGGVFASFLGTLGILDPRDRKRIKGFVINKFRGDPSLLTSAVEFLQRKAGRPVLGVVPLLQRLHLPEEDGVALEDTIRRGGDEPTRGSVRVAVVRLPRISNFTDFTPLDVDPRVDLVYARRPPDIAGAHLVILPGSKDTIADLRFLKTEGFDLALRDHVGRGGAVGGVCGGYQMLGSVVADPHGLESGGEEVGLGLLPVSTRLEPGKVVRRVKARLLAGPWGDGSDEWEAYEIHMGRTVTAAPLAPLFAIRRENTEGTDGLITADGRIWGTYLHGCLDAPGVRERLVRSLQRLTPAAPAVPSVDYRCLREAAYDSLAEALRRSLDLSAIRSLIGF